MNARETAEKHGRTIEKLLTRIGDAAKATADRPDIDWSHSGDLGTALQYAVYAAFALGAVDEHEAKQLGVPV